MCAVQPAGAQQLCRRQACLGHQLAMQTAALGSSSYGPGLPMPHTACMSIAGSSLQACSSSSRRQLWLRLAWDLICMSGTLQLFKAAAVAQACLKPQPACLSTAAFWLQARSSSVRRKLWHRPLLDCVAPLQSAGLVELPGEVWSRGRWPRGSWHQPERSTLQRRQLLMLGRLPIVLRRLQVGSCTTSSGGCR